MVWLLNLSAVKQYWSKWIVKVLGRRADCREGQYSQTCSTFHRKSPNFMFNKAVLKLLDFYMWFKCEFCFQKFDFFPPKPFVIWPNIIAVYPLQSLGSTVGC